MGRKKHYKNPNKSEEEIKKTPKKKQVKKETPKKETPKKVEQPKVEKENIEVVKEEKKEPVKVVEEKKETPKKKWVAKLGPVLQKNAMKIVGIISILIAAFCLIEIVSIYYRVTWSPQGVFKRTINDFFREIIASAAPLDEYFIEESKEYKRALTRTLYK